MLARRPRLSSYLSSDSRNVVSRSCYKSICIRVENVQPYLGHVGLERFRSLDERDRIRVIVNGEVVPAFKAQLSQDENGGYDVREVQEWVSSCIERWDTYRRGPHKNS